MVEPSYQALMVHRLRWRDTAGAPVFPDVGAQVQRGRTRAWSTDASGIFVLARSEDGEQILRFAWTKLRDDTPLADSGREGGRSYQPEYQAVNGKTSILG